MCSVICALGPTRGTLDFAIIAGSMKTDNVIRFLKRLTKIGIQRVILDNSAIHRAKSVK